QGNTIGTTVPVPPGVGNGGGIVVGTPGNQNIQNALIGTDNNGTIDVAEGNTIAGNGFGIRITGDTATNNIVAGNNIFGNAGLGIDLGGDGVTLNHQGNAAGPNAYQNFPVLNLATSDGSSTRVAGTLTSFPGQNHRIDIFANT